jgi:hypothetical protein
MLRGARRGVVFEAAGDGPPMSEGVLEDAVTVTPGTILEREHHPGTGLDRSLEQPVRVFDVEMQRDRRAVERPRAPHTVLRELVVEEEVRVAQGHLRMDDRLPVRGVLPRDLPGPERLAVELDSFGDARTTRWGVIV